MDRYRAVPRSASGVLVALGRYGVSDAEIESAGRDLDAAGRGLVGRERDAPPTDVAIGWQIEPEPFRPKEVVACRP